MDKRPLIGICLCAVVLLVLGSLSNCLRVEAVQGCDCSDPPCWPELSGTMGQNNWYISSVFVGFNGSFYEINYRIDGGGWQTYTAPFGITNDGVHLLEWYCDDNMSNIGSIEIKIDKIKPIVRMNYTWSGNHWIGFTLIYYPYAFDLMSGMNRVELYIQGVFYGINISPGPNYEFVYPLCDEGVYNVRGFILNPKITDNYVKFYCLLVTIFAHEKSSPYLQADAYAYDNAGNREKASIYPPSLPATIVPGPYLFKGVILPNNYTGRIGMFFIDATFHDI
jgi:hypothetical protein